MLKLFNRVKEVFDAMGAGGRVTFFVLVYALSVAAFTTTQAVPLVFLAVWIGTMAAYGAWNELLQLWRNNER